MSEGNGSRLPSRTILEGPDRAAARAYLYGIGYTADDLREIVVAQDVELLKFDYQMSPANHLSGVTDFRDYDKPSTGAGLSAGSGRPR